MNYQKSIDSILNTPKVEALFIFDLEGKFYFPQSPENLSSDDLKKLPEQIIKMYDTIAENFQNCSDLILKFKKKNLYFRKSRNRKEQNFIIAVLGDAGVDFVSLKLATNLALKLIKVDDL